MPRRKRISATISADNHAYLCTAVRSGRAKSIAEALDSALEAVQRVENRERSERATAAYYDGLLALKEENELAEAVSRSAGEWNIDE